MDKQSKEIEWSEEECRKKLYAEEVFAARLNNYERFISNNIPVVWIYDNYFFIKE
jgi:hypothetical protein